MSTYVKNGARAHKLNIKKKTKEHIKRFYSILGDMDVISKQLDLSIEYNEENINEYVLPIYGRELDNMEKFVLLGKLHLLNENKNNI